VPVRAPLKKIEVLNLKPIKNPLPELPILDEIKAEEKSILLH